VDELFFCIVDMKMLTITRIKQSNSYTNEKKEGYSADQRSNCKTWITTMENLEIILDETNE
jgi:hypothetical protein